MEQFILNWWMIKGKAAPPPHLEEYSSRRTPFLSRIPFLSTSFLVFHLVEWSWVYRRVNQWSSDFLSLHEARQCCSTWVQAEWLPQVLKQRGAYRCCPVGVGCRTDPWAAHLWGGCGDGGKADPAAACTPGQASGGVSPLDLCSTGWGWAVTVGFARGTKFHCHGTEDRELKKPNKLIFFPIFLKEIERFRQILRAVKEPYLLLVSPIFVSRVRGNLELGDWGKGRSRCHREWTLLSFSLGQGITVV